MGKNKLFYPYYVIFKEKFIFKFRMSDNVVIPQQFLINKDSIHKIHEKNNNWNNIKNNNKKIYESLSSLKSELNYDFYKIRKDAETIPETAKKIMHGGIWNSYPKFFSIPESDLLSVKKIVILGNPNGLGSCFIETIKWLIIADIYDLEPTIYWGSYTAYWDKETGINAWNYYFKEIGEQNIEKIQIDEINKHFTENISSKRNEYRKIVKDTIYIGLSRNSKVPLFNGNIPFNFGFRNKGDIITDYWRYTVNKYIQKYVYIDSNINNHANKILNDMNELKIGVHIRGANGFDEYCLWKNNPYLEHYEAAINDIISRNNGKNISIYLATDSSTALEYIQSKFKNVYYIDCSRIDSYYADRIGMSEVHSFGHMIDRRSKLGYEALLECLILSKCDYMIHYESNLTVMAAYLNPELKIVHAHLYYDIFVKDVNGAQTIRVNDIEKMREETSNNDENDETKRHNLMWLDWVKGKVLKI